MRQENDRILAFIHDRVAPDVKRARTLTESSSNEECAGVAAILKADMDAFDEVFCSLQAQGRTALPSS